MNDVNASSPGLKLVVENGPRLDRAAASSQAKDGLAPAEARPVMPEQSRTEPGIKAVQAEGFAAKNESQAKELSEKVSQLNDYVQSLHRNLEFQVDNATGQTVVKVVDQETDKVIRQIPDELALRLAEKLQQDEPLTLLNIEV